jgi:hypothetical protein
VAGGGRRRADARQRRRQCEQASAAGAAQLARRTFAFSDARTTGVARQAAPRLAALRAGSTGSGFSAMEANIFWEGESILTEPRHAPRRAASSRARPVVRVVTVQREMNAASGRLHG